LEQGWRRFGLKSTGVPGLTADMRPPAEKPSTNRESRDMKRFSFAIVATAGLMLASCGGNDDSINEADVNAAQSEQLNDISSGAANDAANSMEMETLGNQANQLDQEPSENMAETTDADEEAMNVSGM
jgi:hypothetical protein